MLSFCNTQRVRRRSGFVQVAISDSDPGTKSEACSAKRVHDKKMFTSTTEATFFRGW
jgi:hypothetical protein